METKLILQKGQADNPMPPGTREKRRVLIMGMGNSIVSDDAIGLWIADRIQEAAFSFSSLTVDCMKTEQGGLRILDLIIGYDVLIVLDSIKTGKYPPGTILEIDPARFDCTARSAAIHDADFFTAVELGKRMGFEMPSIIKVFTVEIIDNVTVSEQIHEDVLQAAPEVISQIHLFLEELDGPS